MIDSTYRKYMIVSETDKKWGLTVHSVGTQQILPKMPYPPKDHPTRYLFSPHRGRQLNEYQLLYIVSGKGTFESKSCTDCTLNEGNFFLLFKNEWHNYKPDDTTGWVEYWIGFDGENIESRIKHHLFNPNEPILNVGLREEITALYHKAITLAQEQNPGFQQMLAGIVEHLLSLAYYYKRNMEFGNKAIDNQITKAKILMADNCHQKITPQDIASSVNIGYSIFRKMFKKYTGFSPMQYILEMRIQKSKELLTNTDKSSQEIAFETGFESSVNFCILFKKRTGFTPLQYRNFTQGKAMD